jgi:hypothetical protein
MSQELLLTDTGRRIYCRVLRPLQVHLNRSAALWALAGLAGFHGLRFSERHIKFVGIILGVPAPGAFNSHPDDYRDVIVQGSQRPKPCTASGMLSASLIPRWNLPRARLRSAPPCSVRSVLYCRS